LEPDSEERHNELVSHLALEAGMNNVERVLETFRKRDQ
jgi:hypothetical protein